MAQLLIHLIRLYPQAQCVEILEIQILAISSVAILSQQHFTQFPGTCGAQIRSAEVKPAPALQQMYLVQMCFSLKYLSTL